jgi:hypothetical protein
MKGSLLCAAVLLVATMMMGCTDSIIPCTVDEDCAIDWGWYDNGAAHGGGDIGMVCNLEVSPLERCNEMMAYLPPLDWFPFGDWIVLPDCEELFGGLPEETGTCESSWGWF